MSSQQKQSPRGAINAAEVALGEENPYVAEEALQKALRQVRELQGGDADGEVPE